MKNTKFSVIKSENKVVVLLENPTKVVHNDGWGLNDVDEVVKIKVNNVRGIGWGIVDQIVVEGDVIVGDQVFNNSLLNIDFSRNECPIMIETCVI